MQLTENFTLAEFACHDVAGTPVPEKYLLNVMILAQNLQVLRDYLGERVGVLSGYRTEAYNKSIGGAKNSQHPLAKASDLTVKSKTPKQLAEIIEKLIREKKMKNGGLGIYPGFIHYDIRDKPSRW